jgi:hypothetical protein
MKKYMSAYFILFALLLSVLVNYPLEYSYSDFENYLGILLTVSSMVFTLMGIWIAFLYPNALSRLVNPDKVENADFDTALGETKRLEGLVGSVLKSAFVVTMIMAIFAAKIVLHQSAFYYSHIVIFKSLALTTVAVLSLLQFESIFYVIYSNVMFINELHSKREDREADADI